MTLLAIVLASLASGAAFAQVTLHHQLDVRLEPAAGRITVGDEIRLAEPLKASRSLTFHLSPDLRLSGPVTFDGGVAVAASPAGAGAWRVKAPAGASRLAVRYRGVMRHGLENVSDSPGRRQLRTLGHIGADGVFLDGASPWYPRFGDELVTFDMTVEAPSGWMVVSQGTQVDEAARRWRESQPQDDIYLVANRFRRYRKAGPQALAEVYLRSPDEALAQRYLDATQRYLAFYSKLIGPYPYSKFALVENFWESGYGMPSFTLLGPRVIRLPFIVHTSYPHEILHNWFGNGVYVDYTRGNWSEGLTSYLSDHLLREQRGKGAAYRREALQRYADYVRSAGEFPLKAFRGRHGDASQAIGYGKAMMVFHSLRRRLGDKAFFGGLASFYRQHRFERAGYPDLQRAWEQASGQDLDAFFGQWLNRTGAPRLAVENVEVTKREGRYRVTGVIRQTQAEAPFELRIPLRVEMTTGESVDTVVPMKGRQQRFRLSLAARPARLLVDPDFDVFRQLDPAEIPVTLSRFFGGERTMLILPSAASRSVLDAWRRLASQWAAGRKDQWRIVMDNEIEALPTQGAVLVLGADNRLLSSALANSSAVEWSDGRIVIEGQTLAREGKSIVLALPGRGGERNPVVVVATDRPRAIDGLTRKLPHYGKYSYLVFGGDAPDIEVKGSWRVVDSPLVVTLD